MRCFCLAPIPSRIHNNNDYDEIQLTAKKRLSVPVERLDDDDLFFIDTFGGDVRPALGFDLEPTV